ncbi:MAG: sulfite exporter TauE/SafE family protein [Gemmatimonadota bacterium]
MTIAILLGAFLAGLAGSPHCVLMCGSFASACARHPAGLGAWHIGRLVGYSILGAIAGAVGHALPGPAWLPSAVGAVFLVWFAAALAGLVGEPRLKLPGFSRAGGLLTEGRGTGAQLAFGLVNGFLPCGLVYSALSLPVALANPWSGAAAMIAFGMGTTPATSIAALGFRRLTFRSLAARRWIALLVLITGLLSIAVRSGLLFPESMLPFMHRHGAS